MFDAVPQLRGSLESYWRKLRNLIGLPRYDQQKAGGMQFRLLDVY